MNNGNREYKSDVFSMLMKDPVNALQVYNALNNSELNDPSLVEMCTLDKGISLSVRNDAAFIVDATLSIYEHQSTVCPNMPMRSLIYFTTMVEKLIKKRRLYRNSLVEIPEPQFVVFYNGSEEQPEQYDLKLSDAFKKHTVAPQIEVICKVYNINRGMNKELMVKCKILSDYMTLVNYVNDIYNNKQEDDSLTIAISKAIDKCIEEGILVDFLRENRYEVMKVMTLDYTFERQIALEREEAIKEGRAAGLAIGRKEGQEIGRKEGQEIGRKEGQEIGRAEGQSEIIRRLLASGMSTEEIANICNKSVKEIEELLKVD